MSNQTFNYQGIDVKTYLVALVGAVLVVAAVLAVPDAYAGKKEEPKVSKPSV